MKLDEAIERGLPLAIRIDEGNDRVMAEAFVVPGGLAFADVYWRLSMSGHLFHFIKGEISGDGPWRVGSAEVRVIDHGDPRADEWNRWTAYKATPAGELSRRKEAWEEIGGIVGQ
jgi:hypothetical protein